MEGYYFLCRIREQRQISKERLSAGICAGKELARFEAGEQELDKEVFDILLQRLGISPDKIEVIFRQDEYTRSDALFRFGECIRQGKGEESLVILEQYITPEAGKAAVWKMYDSRCRAMYERYIKKDYKKAEQYLFCALEITLPKWEINALKQRNRVSKHKLDDFLISAVEMENLLALAELWLLDNKEDLTKIDAFLEECYRYIKNAFIDEEECAKVLCKCIWLQADSMIRQGKQKKAFLRCEEALELLRDCGISYFMLPLMERMLSCKEAPGWKRYESKLTAYCDALRYAYELAKEEPPEISMYYNCCKQECHLDREIFLQERLAKGLTQEQICDGIFSTQRSISEIEHGKKVLRKKNFEQLMKKFGLKKGRLNFCISTDSFELLELEDKFTKMSAKEQIQDMEKIINQLKSQLDMEQPENQKAVQMKEIVLDQKESNRPLESLLKEAVKLLEETFEIQKGCYRVPFLEESRLMINIAILLTKLGRTEEAVQLYQQMLEIYQKSEIAERYHYSTVSVIYNNLARRTDSEKLAKQGMQYELGCGKLNSLYFQMLLLVSFWKKQNKKKKECEYTIKSAYWLCELIKNYKDRDTIRRNYKRIYKKDLLD